MVISKSYSILLPPRNQQKNAEGGADKKAGYGEFLSEEENAMEW